jgi:sulfate transport system substrate-binding protein
MNWAKGQFEIVYPSTSILAEPPVALVDKVVDKRGTRTIAEAYLKFLYSDAGQELAAKHHFRPRTETILQKHVSQFPKISLFTIDEVFGGWKSAQKAHFDEGGVFDQISRSRR